MAQKRKKNNKKWLWRVIVLVLFVAAGVVAYLVWDGYFRGKSEENINAGEANAEESITEEGGRGREDSGEVIEKEKVVLYEGEDPNEQEELTGVVTYAGVSGDNLIIRVNIDQYVTEGSCELNLVQGGSVIYADAANITTAATTATCEGFNVSTGGLSGNYQIVIKISSNGKIGTINGEVNV